MLIFYIYLNSFVLIIFWMFNVMCGMKNENGKIGEPLRKNFCENNV